ncbi:MAG: hypothetical protein ACLUHL_07140 [Dysosmobacter welbionis]
MKRELVTGLLTLSLLASMLPANAQAAEGMFGASAAGQVQTMTEGRGGRRQTENTADIDGTQYATLAEAVAQAEEAYHPAAPRRGGRLRLVKPGA